MLNKVMVMGRLTKDPEVRTTQANGKMVASFTLAVNRRLSKAAKDSGQTDADFFSVVAWEKLAESVSTYCKKGKQIVVVGKLQTRNWDDEKGVRHYATEIIADEVIFADSKSDGQGQGQQSQQQTQQQETSPQGFYPIEGEDDLPF